MKLNEKIRILRTQVGMSQQQLADALNVSRAAVAKWENGNGIPDVDNLKAISEYFLVSVDFLLYDTEAMDVTVKKEWIDFTPFSANGTNRHVYDAVVLSRFSESYSIWPVSLQYRFNRGERIANVLTFGLYKQIWQLTHWKEYTGIYYLVDHEEGQFLVEFQDQIMIITCLPYRTRTITGEFLVGDRKFLKLENILEDK